MLVKMRSAWAHPWDVPDRRLETLARRGIDEIQIACVYHAATFVDPTSLRIRRLRGATALLGSPAGTRPSAWLHRTRSVDAARVAERVRAAGFRARAWVVLGHDLRRPSRFAVRTLGGPLAHATCPSQPAARSFTEELIGRVATATTWDGLDVEGFGYYGTGHADHHPKRPERWDLEAERLMSVCFCSACTDGMRRAGVDVRELRRTLRAHVVALLGRSGEPAVPVQQPRMLEEALEVVRDWRASVVRSVVELVHRQWRLHSATEIRLFTTTDHDATGAAQPFDAAWPSQGVGYIVADPGAPRSLIAAQVQATRWQVGPAATIVAGVVPGADSRCTAAAEARMIAAGASRVSWYHLGLIPDAWLSGGSSA